MNGRLGSRMLDFSRKINMLVLVGCWAFSVGASRMLDF